MPISDKDRNYMQQVAVYFRSTKSKENPEGSIRDTASHFGINRNKVRKILITTGDISNPLTKDAAKMQSQGMNIESIADRLGVSTATVSTYLPYTDTIKDGLDPTKHAKAVREYRAHEKERAKRQVQKKEKKDMEKTQETNASWKEEWLKERSLSYTETDTRPARTTWEDARQIKQSMDNADPEMKAKMAAMAIMNEEEEKQERKEYATLREKDSASLSEKEKVRLDELAHKLGLFPGALMSRNVKELDKISGEKIPFEPREVLRLHLEIVGTLDDEEREILHKYGGVKYGDSISRDVVIPSDLPLYALHFLIQRLFGWQNSYRHRFKADHNDLMKVTDNKVAIWAQLVGIIFRSPYMNGDDDFWADDYDGGSFKNWLTKKYTGPYLSQCHGEGIVSCINDIQGAYLVLDSYWYALHVKNGKDDDRIIKMTPVYDEDGNKNPEPTSDRVVSGEQWVEIIKFGDAPIAAVGDIADRGSFDLIERLPINCTLSEDREYFLTGEEMIKSTQFYFARVINSGYDSPDMQVLPEAFTGALYYSYDPGDRWEVKITATKECEDLVRQGRITQEQLDKAQIKCRELYRPVTLAVDGEMVMDDVGGLKGFVKFLQTINPDLTEMNKEEQEEARAKRKEMLDWAMNLQNWGKLNPMI